MSNNLAILIAEDDANHGAMLASMLEEWGYRAHTAADGESAVALYKTLLQDGAPPDLALLDMRMPRLDGQRTLEKLKSINPDLAVILMTAYSDVAAAVEAIRSGAFDYLTKPLDFEKLKITLRNAFAQQGLLKENASLAASLAATRGMVWGSSRAMKEVGKLIAAVAPTEASILVEGESGTGKELAARAIHNLSARKAGPFVAINCGALTETLLASELFGHEKGAFTGADRKHEGLFVAAGGGSIFLDEIGEMPLAMQVKLLRVLQEKEVLSVGGKQATPLDCRIIAATNRNLADEVHKGTFREDLYYRLNVVTIQMPPLRERREDLPVLAQQFASRFASINRKMLAGISSDAMRALQSYHWPGNVRELENVMERAVILMPGDTIGMRELPERISGTQPKDSRGRLSAWQEEESGDCPTLEEIERAAILRTLKKFGNNKTETARALGITRKTLHAKLNRYNGPDPENESVSS